MHIMAVMAIFLFSEEEITIPQTRVAWARISVCPMISVTSLQSTYNIDKTHS